MDAAAVVGRLAADLDESQQLVAGSARALRAGGWPRGRRRGTGTGTWRWSCCAKRPGWACWP